MKKMKFSVFTAILVALLLVANSFEVRSHKVAPTPGACGDPSVNGSNDSTCAQPSCHPHPTYPNDSTILTLLIDTSPTFNSHTKLTSNFQYQANTTYNFYFALNSNTGVYGFEITALCGGAPYYNAAGNFIRTEVAHTTLDTITWPPFQYMGHGNADSVSRWTFQWTAPQASAGPITFYYCYNTSTLAFLDSTPAGGTSGAGVPGGQIYCSSITVQPAPSAINEIPGKLTALHIFPNPVSTQLGISFNLQQTELVTGSLYSLDGKLVKNLANSELLEAGSIYKNYDVKDIAPGVYLVRLNVGGSFITQKIVKQ
jgi:hypothetical protein